MDTQKLYDLIDKVIGKKGPLRVPAYWMRRVLNSIVKKSEQDIANASKSITNSVTKSLTAIEKQLNELTNEVKTKLDVLSPLVLTDKYLAFVALEDGLTVRLNGSRCEYSLDGYVWHPLSAYSETPAINTGQYIWFRAKIAPIKPDGIGTFGLNKKCSVKGNIMSMLYGDNSTDNQVMKPYAFMYLFSNARTLIDASQLKLPTALATHCYDAMFHGCSALVNAPELPATTLAEGCYFNMFARCESLVNAPKLPATALTVNCYQGMFYYCSALVNAPELPATTLAEECYDSMFRDCESLVNAPELPATELVKQCYDYMFDGCTNLSYVKAMFIMLPTPYGIYIGDWLKDVAAEGTFVKNAAATWDTAVVIPEGWSVETVEVVDNA